MPESVRCGACGHDNPPGHRFCGQCGTALPRACTRCGAAAPPDARFCGQCGTPLPDAPVAPAPATAPAPGSGSGAGAGPDPLESASTGAAPTPLEERRVATVLFADLSGFTALSDGRDPEEVREVVDRCMTLLGEIVDRFGGHVDKVIGDALLALWGVPIAREDHAERAVRAALEMQECARSHAEEFAGLQLRVGVNTGELMFAPVGPEGRREQTVMGDVVNVASRLQTSAPRGGVLVGEPTWRVTRRAIRYQQVEPFTVKGKEEPLDGWLALGALAATPAERPLSDVPMVGRTRELEVLWTTWRRVVDDRQAHFVVVLGPPGVGKSRLNRELRLRVEADGARAVRSRSIPYGEQTGYGAFAEAVRQICGILETDSPVDASDKLTSRIASLVDEPRRDEVATAMAIVTGLGPGEFEGRAQLFDAARELVEGLGREQPTVLGFEDLHWAEETLVDLVEHLAARVRDAPVLVLASARPELLDARPALGGGLRRYVALTLDPLTEEDGASLAHELLRDRPVAPSVLERIAEAAGGNPLFLEELATSVAEGSTDPTERLPTSVVSIISARLDALPARERSLLLNAAVIGRTFARDLLVALDDQPGLDDALDRLEERDHIRRERASQLDGDRTYSFRHTLLREVAYNTLPRAERRQRHATVARAAEERYAARTRQLAATLAHHWRAAGEEERAIEYLLDAAEQASQAWAKREAVLLYSEVLDALPEGDPRRRTVSLRRALADQAWAHIRFGDVPAPPTTDGESR